MRFEAYATACLPETHTILGLRLKPICLGHYILMKRFGCNFASDEETNIDVSDLIVAVLICSMSYEDCVAFFDQPSKKFLSLDSFKSLGKAWYLGKELGGAGYEIRCWGEALRKKIRKDKSFNILTTVKQFQKYLKNGTEMPLFFEGKNNDDKPPGAHWSVSLKAFLLSKYSESQAMNLPLSQAFMEYCKWAEEQGAIELFQPYEEEMAKGVPVV